MIRRFALASAILIAAASATPAMAGTATSNLSVSASVPESCNITAAPVVFNNYDPIGVHNDATGIHLTATGTLSVTCTLGTSATILLNQGSSPSGMSTDESPVRKLLGPSGNRLDYYILHSGEDWGNTIGTGVATTGTGASEEVVFDLVIPRGQSVLVGTYTDTVVATVSY